MSSKMSVAAILALAESMARDAGHDGIMGAVEEMENMNCEHHWYPRRMGGEPTDISSGELVVVCKHCGCEKVDNAILGV